MLKIKHITTMGWETAVRGMRNPLNSWEKNDSELCMVNGCLNCELFNKDNGCMTNLFIVGNNDLELMKTLAKAGSDHRKFMRYIIVTMDITGPLYWWKEYDTYKVGTVANSCSTMHKIHDKAFEIGDFSFEHLYSDVAMNALGTVIEALNHYRDAYLESKNKEDWWQLIQLLPSSYNQKRTVLLNYENLRSMHNARKNHKLDEWHDFCKMVETLPYAKELIFEAE